VSTTVVGVIVLVGLLVLGGALLWWLAGREKPDLDRTRDPRVDRAQAELRSSGHRNVQPPSGSPGP
jgi:hypothetical protein